MSSNKPAVVQFFQQFISINMKQRGSFSKSEQGISIVEIVVVILLIGIISAIAVGTLTTPKLYNAENQALRFMDLMREAQQRALTQKKTMRVEINSTQRFIRLIDENEVTGSAAVPTAANDIIVKTIPYVDGNTFLNLTPTNMTATPAELTPVLPVAFANSTHPTSVGNQVLTMRFMSNGTVRSAGTDAIGSNSTPTGATIYVWSRRDSDTAPTPTVANVLRAVTVLGTSGSTKLWKCGVTASGCTAWTR